MKATRKTTEPAALARFRTERPTATWEQLREAPGLYALLKERINEDQRGICAYCEVRIDAADSLRFRIEHFHSKGVGVTEGVNWALWWPNLLGVCLGGCQPASPAPHYLPPLPDNLSCDAHKQHLESRGRLPIPCRGHVIDPSSLPTAPRLFRYEYSTGMLRPDEQACASVTLEPNERGDTAALVQASIDTFNLNCDRLCRARKVVAHHIERLKKEERKNGQAATEALPRLAARLLRPIGPWPEFFTTVRSCLGAAAEGHLLASGELLPSS